MANAIVGAAGKANTLSSLWARDVEDKIVDIIGEDGKLTKFLSLHKDDDVSATEAEWIVTNHVQPFTTIRTAPTAGLTDTTFAINDSGTFGPGDIVFHPSGETARVLSVVNTAGAATITLESRNRGGTGAVTWALGDQLINLGSAKDDGDTLGAARISQDVVYTNPVQIYFERVEFDGTAIAINEKKGIYGGDFVARKRAQTLRRILQQMDMNALFGQAAYSAGVGTTSVRTMGGIRPHIAAANKATIATLTQAALEGFMATRPDMRGGSENMLVIGSGVGVVGLNSYATSRIQAAPGGKRIGYQLEEFVTPIGTLTVMEHYNLSKITALKGLLLFIKRDELVKKVLRPLKLYGDVNTGLVDVRTDAFLGQHTLALGSPDSHGEINGTTAYA